MNTARRPISFQLGQVQPCTSQQVGHERTDPILETLVPRPDKPDIYVALCKCQYCHALLFVAAGHVPETEESVWQLVT